ncbi:MAG: hypothetical protein HOK25_08515 [Rhodospirillaceae bacterium]|nr:hypothetical protein [Rhodospirillaceae bacterium]
MRTARMNIHRWVSIFLVAAVALHGVLPMAQAGTGSMPAPEAGSLEAALRVICTGHGTQPLPSEPDQQPLGLGDECRSCPLPCSQTLFTPTTHLVRLDSTERLWAPFPLRNLFHPRIHVSGTGSRAPPRLMGSTL